MSNKEMMASLFQSTHPCGVRRTLQRIWEEAMSFQSTHPCGVRLRNPIKSVFDIEVSIHAPLRGATRSLLPPPRLARRFNPRTPAGCDQVHIVSGARIRPVSIHAPLRGATYVIVSIVLAGDVSIHAPLRGATEIVGVDRSMISFQSTHPCGVRLQPIFQV